MILGRSHIGARQRYKESERDTDDACGKGSLLVEAMLPRVEERLRHLFRLQPADREATT